MEMAKVVDGVVTEVFRPLEGFELIECFHPDILAQAIQCPANVDIGWLYDGEAFTAAVEPLEDLDVIKKFKIVELTAECATAITSGYQSTALGSSFSYPSGITDQLNMMGSVTAGMLPDLPPDWSTPFWCSDVSGVWAFRNHTAAQIIEVGHAGKEHVVICQLRLAELSDAVRLAENVSQVRLINWIATE